MEDTSRLFKRVFVLGAAILAICALGVPAAFSQPVPGGTLNPTTIPKYVTPLVIPPVMPQSTVQPDGATPGTPSTISANYNIAVRQFQQQILPGPANGAAMGNFPSTTVWSYGREQDQTPALAPVPLNAATPSSFNYPAWTIETTSTTGPGSEITVRWINGLEIGGVPLPYLIPGVVDQTLHWANPARITPCLDTGLEGTDCRTDNPAPYTGAIPMVVHVHGAHVNPQSDGYPEAWWLPASASATTYALTGTLFDEFNTANDVPGSAFFGYENDQPSTTLWYHDHTLGMTRLNVYAGPAGFWLIRDPAGVGGETGLGANMILPGPAPALNEDPNFVAATRAKIREIPIAIQDRSFNLDGSLFYPDNRAFFEGLPSNAALGIPLIGNPAGVPPLTGRNNQSDISPIWNPEAFFNVMVVNGVSWPVLQVAPAQYRFRLLDGCNSRFLNLAMFVVGKGGSIKKGQEIPFFQIGAEQSTLPQVVMIQTGFATPLTPGLPLPPKNQWVKAASKDQALLMGPAERADVIVDFSALPNGTRIRMINTAPDAPFGGFPDVAADPGTTGQVMEFVVNTALMNGGTNTPGTTTDPFLQNGQPNVQGMVNFAATLPQDLVLGQVQGVGAFPTAVDNAQDQALIEEESTTVCVTVSPNGAITWLDLGDQVWDPLNPNNPCLLAGGVPFAPKAAVLGKVDPLTGLPVVTLWSDAIATNPGFNTTEVWNLNNFTVDAHPIHLHLVKFKVTNRRLLGTPPGTLNTSIVPGNGVQPWENGWKDTVIAYPGETTSLAATFDIGGLYVWHCHIVEHEDNEMMVPYCVGTPGVDCPAGLF